MTRKSSSGTPRPSPGMPALSTGAKAVALAVAAGLAAMLVWSVAWRAGNPSLVVQPRQHSAPPAQAEGDGPSMGMVTALMQKLAENPKDVHVLHTLAEQFMRMQAWDKAESLLARALVVEPGNASVLNLMGICEFNLKRYRDAADKFELLLGLEPDNLMARFNLGVLYGHYLDDKAKGRGHFQAVVDAPGVDEDLRREAGEALKSLD
ncbi:tetratricopeptide repeat protein [Desulfocurvus sp. DL9XJH121]